MGDSLSEKCLKHYYIELPKFAKQILNSVKRIKAMLSLQVTALFSVSSKYILCSQLVIE